MLCSASPRLTRNAKDQGTWNTLSYPFMLSPLQQQKTSIFMPATSSLVWQQKKMRKPPVVAISEGYAEPNEFDERGIPCVEVYFSSGMGKCLMSHSNLLGNEYAVMQVLWSGVKAAETKRDTDALTPQEIERNQEQIKAAMLEELTIWQKYECFVTPFWQKYAIPFCHQMKWIEEAKATAS